MVGNADIDLGGIVGAPVVVFCFDHDAGVGVGKANDAVWDVVCVDIVVDLVASAGPFVVGCEVSQHGFWVFAYVQSAVVAVDFVVFKVGSGVGSAQHYACAVVCSSGAGVVADDVCFKVSGGVQQVDAGDVVFDEIVVDMRSDGCAGTGEVPGDDALFVVVMDVVVADFRAI